MSFVRVPRRTQSASSVGRRPKRKHKKRPTWDDTTTDLSVHKLSRAEVDRRHEVHQSKNLDAIKEARRQQALAKAQKARLMNASNQAGLLREILYDEKQLNEAIAHSDRVMSVVQDLFGDDPKRLRSLPHVTLAPGLAKEGRRQAPIMEAEPHTSHLDILSESVMDPHALNDVQGEEYDTEDDDDDDDEGDKENMPVFDSKLDLNKFQNFITKQHREIKNDDPSRSALSQKLLQHSSQRVQGDPLSTPDGKMRTQDVESGAINDTAKVKRKLRSRSKVNSQGSEQDSGKKTRHEDLIKVMRELQDQIDILDTSRGHDPSSSTFNLGSQGAPSLSGYTIFLVQTIAKLVGYLNESEARWQREREEKKLLEVQVNQQRELIDAITVDMIKSQELHLNIQSETRLQVNQLEQRLQAVERKVDKKPETPVDSQPDPNQDIPIKQSSTNQKSSIVDSVPGSRGTETVQNLLPGNFKPALGNGQQESSSVVAAQSVAFPATGFQSHSKDSTAYSVPRKDPSRTESTLDSYQQLVTNVQSAGTGDLNLDHVRANLPVTSHTSVVPNDLKIYQPAQSETLKPQMPVATGISSSSFLPLQPAMLLSPPRQKDRRAFIRPPGYGPISTTSSVRQPLIASNIGQSNVRIPSSIALTESLTATVGHAQGENPERHVPVSSRDFQRSTGNQNTNVNHSTDRNGIIGGNVLLNNFVGGLNKPKHKAHSVISVGSTSTRYLSLPGEREDSFQENSALLPDLQQGTALNHPMLLMAQQNLAGPSHGAFPDPLAMGLDTMAGASSLELSEKIASLSRQHAEAQARLERLKDLGGIDGLQDGQRMAAGGGTATARALHREQAYQRNTGILEGASPPISPIPRDPAPSEPTTTATTSESTRTAPVGRTIHVSIPKLDELEISATSTPASKRASFGTTGPSPAASHSDWKTPDKNTSGENQFFALKAHLSSS